MFWDDDSNKCGRVGVGISAEEDTYSDEIEEEGNGNGIGEEGFDGEKAYVLAEEEYRAEEERVFGPMEGDGAVQGNDTEEGFDGGAEVDTSGDNNAFGEEDSNKGIEQVKGPDDGAEGDEMSELDKARLHALAEEEYRAEVERVEALELIEEDGEMQP